MATLFYISLVLHITGVVLLAGTNLLGYFVSKRFWSAVAVNVNKAIVINSITIDFARITAIGGVLTILSGLTMVFVLHGAVASQLWFRIKMMLVLFIILNALLVERPQNSKLKKILSEEMRGKDSLAVIKSRLGFYYALQFLMLLTIFVLSVFKFS